MSSTLTVTNLTATNLTDGGGTTSTFANVTSGIAKAWINFNGTGTIATRDSHNVSSLTDKGTGSYNVNFSNNMSDGNYAGITSGDGTGVANVICVNANSSRSNTTAASGYGIAPATSSANADLSYVYLAVHGDLA